MIVFRKLVIVAIAAAIFAGCSAPVRMHPPAAPREVEQKPKARYTYDHKLDPAPGYQPKDIDALAEGQTDEATFAQRVKTLSYELPSLKAGPAGAPMR